MKYNLNGHIVHYIPVASSCSSPTVPVWPVKSEVYNKTANFKEKKKNLS